MTQEIRIQEDYNLEPKALRELKRLRKASWDELINVYKKVYKKYSYVNSDAPIVLAMEERVKNLNLADGICIGDFTPTTEEYVLAGNRGSFHLPLGITLSNPNPKVIEIVKKKCARSLVDRAAEVIQSFQEDRNLLRQACNMLSPDGSKLLTDIVDQFKNISDLFMRTHNLSLDDSTNSIQEYLQKVTLIKGLFRHFSREDIQKIENLFPEYNNSVSISIDNFRILLQELDLVGSKTVNLAPTSKSNT